LNDAVASPEGEDIASVGSQLRLAREAARLSLDEVANALKFSPRQIELLEADQYAALPGSTIVRGFVRNYARLLRLDADSLLRQLEGIVPSAPAEVRPPDNMGIASQPRGLRELSPLVVIALVILLAASLLVLWHFFGPVVPQAAPPTDSTQAIPQQEQTVSGAPTLGSVITTESVMPPLAPQNRPCPHLPRR